MSCDIRIAADTARFGLPETNLSVLPAAGGTQRLARLVGTGRAIEMILTGRLVDAAEAQRIGLVTSVVPGAELLDKAREIAGQIMAKGPLAVRLAKLVIRSGMDADQRTGLVVERLAQALLYTTDDKTEGADAFLAKRRPVFQGDDDRMRWHAADQECRGRRRRRDGLADRHALRPGRLFRHHHRHRAGRAGSGGNRTAATDDPRHREGPAQPERMSTPPSAG